MDDDTFALIDCDGKVDGIRCGPRERVTTDRTRTAVRDLYFNRQVDHAFNSCVLRDGVAHSTLNLQRTYVVL
jgi:hypothetical protein